MAVAGRFGADEAPIYDERIRRLVPGYELLQQLVRAELRARLTRHARLLVVGAGTGAEVVGLAPTEPGWSFVAVDPAAPMLEVARTRAADAGCGERVHWSCGHVADLGPEPPFDGAVMLLVAHFVPADGAKQELFADVAQRLAPGAPLVFADVATTARPGSVSAAVRHVAATELGADAATADLMIDNMARTLYPVDGPDLDTMLAGAGLTPASPFFQALGYRGWTTTRVP